MIPSGFQRGCTFVPTMHAGSLPSHSPQHLSPFVFLMIKTGWWWGWAKAVVICIPLMPKDVEYFVFLMLVCYLCFSSWELYSVLQFMFTLRCSFSWCLVFEILCLSQTLVSCQMYNWWGCFPILWAVSSIQCFLCFAVSMRSHLMTVGLIPQMTGLLFILLGLQMALIGQC